MKFLRQALIWAATCALLQVNGQWLSVGAKGGLTLTAVEETSYTVGRISQRNEFAMKRYLFGPTIEAKLPWGFRFEGDALYRRVRSDWFTGPAPSGAIIQYGGRLNVWETPLLLKHHLPTPRVETFVTAGSSLRWAGDLTVDALEIPTFPGYSPTHRIDQYPADDHVRIGITVGAGISKRLGILHLSPEIRYTHWTSQHYLATTEQVDFLLGVTFP